jgi:hypothetical protein
MSASSAAIAPVVAAKSDEGGWNLVMKSERITAPQSVDHSSSPAPSTSWFSLATRGHFADNTTKR